MTLTDLMALRSELQGEAARYQAEIERLRAILDRAEELIVEASLDIDLLDVPAEAAAADTPAAAPKPKPAPGKKRRQRRTPAEIAEIKARVVELAEAGATKAAICRETDVYRSLLDRWIRVVPEIRAAWEARVDE